MVKLSEIDSSPVKLGKRLEKKDKRTVVRQQSVREKDEPEEEITLSEIQEFREWKQAALEPQDALPALPALPAVEEDLLPPMYVAPEASEPDSLTQEKDYVKDASKVQKLQRKLLGKKSKTILVTMELSNGHEITFLAFIHKDGARIVWQKKVYVIDMSIAKWNVSSNLWHLTFKEGFSLPIDKRIELKEVRDAFSSVPGIGQSVEYATNPTVLWRFLKSSVQDLILKGGALDAFMRLIRLLLILLLIEMTVILGIICWKLKVFGGGKT